MSFENFLNQTCMITRPTANVERDRYNASTYSDVVVGADVCCRLIEKSVKMLNAQTAEYTWIKVKVLLLPATVTVKRLDEATVNGVVYRIVEPLVRQRGNENHHVSCVVEAVNV